MKANTIKHPVGAHMSIAGGVFNAVLRGAEIGCDTIQMFTKSNQQWKARKLQDAEIKQYFDARYDTGVSVACSHASYLINMASPDLSLFNRSISAFKEELRRCDLLDIPHLVVHPGSHVGQGVDKGLTRIAKALNKILDSTPDRKCHICLETTAGQGTNLGSSFEELERLIDSVEDDGRISVCVDTCHIFAAGYEIRTVESYQKTMRKLIRALGKRRIAIFHINDSKFELGSRKDRHEHIGQGMIGAEGFRLLMNDKRFSAVPKILETPKGDDSLADIENLKRLREYVGVVSAAA